METIKTNYYGCLQTTDGKVIKKRFDTREEAREYIRQYFNDSRYCQFWTE